MDFGLLILRLCAGAILAAHGAQKLFGSFKGPGLKGTAGFFSQLGFKPAGAFAVMAGASEFGGGLMLALGFLTPFAAAAIIGTMVVAIATVHVDKGLFATEGGYELPLTNAAIAAALAFIGPGLYSLDAAFKATLAGPAWGVIAIVLGMVGATGALAARSVTSRKKVTS
jgi:putative oxidoreductase